jgi:hypothetical protein
VGVFVKFYHYFKNRIITDVWERRLGMNVCTYLITPWGIVLLEKLPRFAASQEISRILWNPKGHCRIHKCPPPVPILSQLDPIHTSTSHFPKVHLNIIIPSTPGSPKWSLTFRFPHQSSVYASPLHHKRYVPRPSHSHVCDMKENNLNCVFYLVALKGR